MTRSYRLAYAFEDISRIAALDGVALTHSQRVRAAQTLLVWVRSGAWAGLGHDLSNWPAGDPVRLLIANIAQRDEQRRRNGGKHTSGYTTAGLFAALRSAAEETSSTDALPAPDDLDAYDAALLRELSGEQVHDPTDGEGEQHRADLMQHPA